MAKQLRDYSRQSMGISGHILFDETAYSMNKELVQLSIQLRIAEALEKQTAILERLHPEPQQVTMTGENKVKAHLDKGSNKVFIEVETKAPEQAAALFDQFGEYVKGLVKQEGGESNG